VNARPGTSTPLLTLQENDAFQLTSSVMHLHRLLVVTMRHQLKEHRLSLPEYMLLVTLECTDPQTRPLSSLARDLLAPLTSVSQSVDRLHARQLLTRSSHPEDRRTTLVTISEHGTATLREANRALSEIGFGIPDPQSATCRELTEVLTRLRRSLGDVAGVVRWTA
jgi:DNA-binding MarR family transcriptional regulator